MQLREVGHPSQNDTDRTIGSTPKFTLDEHIHISSTEVLNTNSLNNFLTCAEYNVGRSTENQEVQKFPPRVSISHFLALNVVIVIIIPILVKVIVVGRVRSGNGRTTLENGLNRVSCSWDEKRTNNWKAYYWEAHRTLEEAEVALLRVLLRLYLPERHSLPDFGHQVGHGRSANVRNRALNARLALRRIGRR